ncbi:MAG: hypothetical protein HYY23_03635 [Verrucomicrobia bacterium]|nr:hypothetical protein [Verrucomicrobiota bacterium]
MQSLSFKSLLIPLLASGFGAWSPQAAIYNEVGGRVVVEAEHYDSLKSAQDDDHKWVVVPDTPAIRDFNNARGGKFLQVQPDSGQNRNTRDYLEVGPHALYKVQITTPGVYRLWLRWSGYDDQSDSMYGRIVEITSPFLYRYALRTETDFSGGGGWHGDAAPNRYDFGGGDKPANFSIPAPGIYTIDLGQREDGCTVDALILQLASLPDPTDPGPPESPLASAVLQPLIASPVPSPGTVNALFYRGISVSFQDGATKLVPSSVVLELDGATVAATSSKQGDITTVSFVPATLWGPGSVHTAKVTYKDDQNISFTNEWSFTVQNYDLIRANAAVTPDTSKRGFLVRTWKSPGQPYDLAWTEEQLAGKRGENEADTSQFTEKLFGNAYYAETGTINYWNSGGQGYFPNTDASGNFVQNTPGLANDGTDDDSYSLEILTYLDLPAGVVQMGVISDDGFRVSFYSGDLPDKIATTLGEFNSGRGVSSTDFTFAVEKAGVYPFRMIYMEGYLFSTVEWYTIAPDGSRHLINDPKDASAIKAYRAFVPYTAPPPPTDKPKITSIKADGKSITLEWAGTATLQAADDLTGPWADVAGVGSDKAIAITGNRRFYRLKQ